MAIQKRFIHFKKFSDFNSKKLSANEANTQYTVGISGEIQDGEPDVLYQSYCWIKDTQNQWTHGQLYDGSIIDLSQYLTADEIAEVYATIDALDSKQEALISGTNIKTINGESILGEGNLTIEGGESVQPDWNAQEGESGYIKNKTHYGNFIQYDIPTSINLDTETAISIDIYAVNDNIYVNYRYEQYNINETICLLYTDKEVHTLANGPVFRVRRDGNSIYILGNYDANQQLFVATKLTKLSDVYIPNTIARTEDIVSPMVSTTYSELVSLRDNSQLVPGQQYRITDYITTTTQVNTQSAGHQFDIIVTADDVNILNEKARAIQHEGDTYFAESDLNVWELWYCLDNDTERFSWVAPTIDPELVNGSEFITPFIPRAYMWNDPVNGDDYATPSGDMFYEWASEQENGVDTIVIYKSDPDIYESEGTDYECKFYYRGVVTIDGVEYDSWQKYDVTEESYILSSQTIYILTDRIVKHCKGAIYRMIDEKQNDCPYDFKNIMFKHPKDTDTYPDYYYTFTYLHGGTITDLSFIDNCHQNTIKSNRKGKRLNFNNIVFINTSSTRGCYDNSFEEDCNYMCFGHNCYSFSFGKECYNNSFGDECRFNVFGDRCRRITFGDGCIDNTFGNFNIDNSFGNDCIDNILGNGCQNNSFGNECQSISLGNDCLYNSIRKQKSSSELRNSCKYIRFNDGCSYNVLCNLGSTPLQNINVNKGVCGISETSLNFVEIESYANYEIQVAKNTKGDIKIYCEADLIA